MIARPKVGQRIRVHYAKARAAHMPLHGAVGVVTAVGNGPGPRNVMVRLEQRGEAPFVVPCGNLQRV